MVSTKIHGVADYMIGVLLIALPWLLPFSSSGASVWIIVLVGISIITYSVFTNYELGIVKLIPMPFHLILDIISGVVLITAPWLFNFHTSVMWPHILAGVLIIGITIRSSDEPSGLERTERSY